MTIVNRVAQNESLEVVDLEEVYPKAYVFSMLDIADWLFQEQILREKEFRNFVEAHNWAQYQDQVLILTCRTQAILPSWAYLLLTSKAQGIAKQTVLAKRDFITQYYHQYILNLDTTLYQDKIVMLKGCSKHEIPQEIYMAFIEKIQPVVRRISYGEACSSVPVYKK